MPLNPSSYSKIFKSKYVTDDDDEEEQIRGNLRDIDEEAVPIHDEPRAYVPTYSNPKVQELLSKPKPNFDKIFSSRYLNDGNDVNISFGSRKSEVRDFGIRSTSVPVRAVSPMLSSIKIPPKKDYDKIFTSKYLSEDYDKPKRSCFNNNNPYLSKEDLDSDSDSEGYQPKFHSTVRIPPKKILSEVPKTLSIKPPIQLNQSIESVSVRTPPDELSSKISDFLHRTDHVGNQWESLGKARKRHGNDLNLTGKSRSATNIMLKGFRIYSERNSSSRCSENSTRNEIDEVPRN